MYICPPDGNTGNIMQQLFTAFAPVSAEQWEQRLERDLKGITFEELSSVDRNGIKIKPFYTAEQFEGQPPSPLPAATAGWSICTKIKVTAAGEANQRMLKALNEGASGIHLIIDELVDPAVLFANIGIAYLFLRIDLNEHTLSFAPQFRSYLESVQPDITGLNLYIGLDMAASCMLDGKKNIAGSAPLFHQFLSATKGMNNLCIDAGIFQNAGVTSVFELACLLAQLNEYLHLAGSDNSPVTGKILLATATDTSFFEQIAKLRALKLLAAQILATYQRSVDIHLHVETSNTYRSPVDTYSNLLRDTIAGMAATIGGCNSLYIYPFDAQTENPREQSERLSRNQQLIFQEESYLNRVSDIAAGSYYIEALTKEIAEKAWAGFQEIEAKGGLWKMWDDGSLQQIISSQARELLDAYSSGEKILVGVNKFVNPDEAIAKAPPVPLQNGGIAPLQLAHALLQKSE